MILAVKTLDGGLSLFISTHFDEGESLASAALAILNHLRRLDRAERREQSLQVGTGNLEIEISHIQPFAHERLSHTGLRSPTAKGSGRTVIQAIWLAHGMGASHRGEL